jgi:mRNA interferase ChpB
MRPVLVVSPDAFNKLTKAPIVVPITSGGNFARLSGFTVELIGSKTMGVVRCDQPRALDLGVRKAKKLERVSAEVMDDVLAKLITLIS